MTEKASKRIAECYIQYCDVIKPLIARIEAYSEKFPLPLFNEIRAFNDHIARCYYLTPSDSFIDDQIDKASRHILRITLDCFKCLIVIMFEQIERFEKHTRYVDLTVIDNGTFYPDYSRLKVDGAAAVRRAKTLESYEIEKALREYEKAYDIYDRIIESINQVKESVRWARVRFTTRRILTVIAWVASVIISAVISALFTCELFSRLF